MTASPQELARQVLDDHPHLDRLWWRVDSEDEGVIVTTVEPVEAGWTALDRDWARCQNCERCTWNPGPDCGGWTHEHQADGTTRQVGEAHPHCEACGHCRYRHRLASGGVVSKDKVPRISES